jgi:hypothetical protein
VKVAELAYYLTLQIEKAASSALMLVAVRSAREQALAVIVDAHSRAAAASPQPDPEHARDAASWRARLAQAENENFLYLRAYVQFLERCERAFQVELYTEPAKAAAFIDRLARGEVSVLLEEVERQRREDAVEPPGAPQTPREK